MLWLDVIRDTLVQPAIRRVLLSICQLAAEDDRYHEATTVESFLAWEASAASNDRSATLNRYFRSNESIFRASSIGSTENLGVAVMLRKTIAVLAGVACLGLISMTDASARGGFGRGGGGFHGGGFHGGGFHGGGFHGGGFRGGWRGGGWRGPAIGLGVGLGLAGAYGGWGYPYAYGYPASYAYYGGGDCYYTRRRVWTTYGWQLRPVRVCSY